MQLDTYRNTPKVMYKELTAQLMHRTAQVLTLTSPSSCMVLYGKSTLYTVVVFHQIGTPRNMHTKPMLSAAITFVRFSVKKNMMLYKSI